MEPRNNLRLLVIALYLGASLSLARPQLSPDIAPIGSSSALSPGTSSPSQSPSLELEKSPSPSPSTSTSFSPAAGFPENHVSVSPSPSQPPSTDVSDDDGSSLKYNNLLMDDDDDSPSESNGVSDSVLSSSLAAVKTNPEVSKICDSTDHPDLCLSTVGPLIKGDVDVQSVLKAAVDAGYDYAKVSFSKAKELAEKPNNAAEIVSILNDCKDSYDTAVSNYESTISAQPAGDVGTMNSMLSAVMTFVGDCEDLFTGMGIDSPLAEYAVKLTNMTSNCLAIVSLMNQS